MNRHLNIYQFYNSNDAHFIEDNLSRGFALCLLKDNLFLDTVLRQLLNSNEYFDLFNTDYPDYEISIDLQVKTQELLSYDVIIAVACSGKELSFSNIESLQSFGSNNPITDVTLSIRNICIIFEFKRSDEDCRAQLKNQVDSIINLGSSNPKTRYVDFNWRKITKSLINTLSIQRQTNSVNNFCSDFYSFIEQYNPNWFPIRNLNQIPFPINSDDPNFTHLNNRLNQIKQSVAKKLKTEVEIKPGKFARKIVQLDWGFAKELHINSSQTQAVKSLKLSIWIGDSKWQGTQLFHNRNTSLEFPESIEGSKLEAIYYLKFSHFNSQVYSLELSSMEAISTHNFEFFSKWAGRHKRNESWDNFISELNRLIPEWNMRSNYEFDTQFTHSGRNQFDLSIGVRLNALLPYSEAQKLDSFSDESQIAERIVGTVNGIYNHLSTTFTG